MPLKNVFFLFGFVLLALPSLAQEPVITYSNDKSTAKKQRINQMLKMEEDGDLIFDHHSVFGFRLATDGYGIFYEKGKYVNNSKSRLYQFEINEKKDPKDHKEAVGGYNGYSYNSISVGRLNNFYEFKASYGEQFLIGGKGNKNGVAITALYSGGLSLGMLKRYVMHVYKDQQTFLFQSTYPTIFDSAYLVNDALGLGGGWNQLTFAGGVNAKLAMRFDYGRFNQNITAIESGLTFEYYFKKMPLMYLVPYHQFFFNAYISIMFGKRK